MGGIHDRCGCLAHDTRLHGVWSLPTGHTPREAPIRPGYMARGPARSRPVATPTLAIYREDTGYYGEVRHHGTTSLARRRLGRGSVGEPTSVGRLHAQPRHVARPAWWRWPEGPPW